MRINLRAAGLVILGVALALWLPAYLTRRGLQTGALAATIAEACAATALLKLSWPDRIADPLKRDLAHLGLTLMIMLEVLFFPCLIFFH